MSDRLVRRAALILICCCAAAHASVTAPGAARASAHFDAKSATDAWLATVPAAQRARSDAYFEGGYWLQLSDVLWSSAAMLLLLFSGWSAKMRDIAARLTRWRWLQAFLFFVLFAVAGKILNFPLTIYEGYFREHQYGLSNQTLGAWLRDQAVGFAAVLIPFGGVAFVVLLAIVRRYPQSWHIIGAVALTGMSAVAIALGPVYIAPLFNRYTPLPDSALKAQILSLARANGIPATDVYEVDASKQSKRVSANVSGFAGTDRITLNDNLLKRVSPEGVMAVMGHEMGHYVMRHVAQMIVFIAIGVVVMLWSLRWSCRAALARWGSRCQVNDIADPAALPLVILIGGLLLFLMTPISNTIIRTQEYEADIFGLNAARQPDGEAEVDLLLGEYRKLDPSPLEEWIFFDHPGGRTRIYAAMRWKAEHLCLFDPTLKCAAR